MKVSNAKSISSVELEIILKNISDGLLFADKDDIIQYCNLSARLIRGLDEDPTGINIEECHKVVGAKKVREIFEKLKSRELSSYRCSDIQVKNNYFEIIYSPAFDEKGEFQGIVALSRDLTERKKLEKELHEQTKKLHELSIRDGLTSLYNHRHLIERLDEEIVRSVRTKLPLAIALFDVDKFKQYNDKFGHLAGDALLRLISNEIQQNVRKKFDSCYRYGGDEFVVLFPSAAAEAASEVMERVSQKISSIEPMISLSIGILNRTEESAWDLISKADDAMYKAKKSGGNKIVVINSREQHIGSKT